MKGALLVAWAAWSIAHARRHADAEPLTLRVERETRDDTRMLSLDPVILSKLEGLTGNTKRTTTTVTLGRTRVILEGIESANVDTPAYVHEDLVTRGWRAGLRVRRDVGHVSLEASAALGHAETPSLMFTDFGLPTTDAYKRQAAFSQGDYYELGVSATKHFTLLDHAAWVSLFASRRVWLGSPPIDEPQASFQLMLMFGLTF